MSNKSLSITCVILLLIYAVCIYFYSQSFKGEEKTIAVNNAKIPQNKADNNKNKINVRSFKDKEPLIDNKPILDLTYDSLEGIWGVPKEIKKIKTRIPGDLEASYIYILRYNDMEIEMYPTNNDTPVENTKSFRFDITAPGRDFFGIRIGMTEEQYLYAVENKETYLIKDILKADSENSKIPFQYKKLLTTMKEENCYNDYDKAIYEEIIFDDVKPYGLVILIKNNKVARIVYGNPNAN